MRTRQTSYRRGIEPYSVVALSLISGLKRLWVMPEYFEERWGYGTFYVPLPLCWPNRTILLLGFAGNSARASCSSAPLRCLRAGKSNQAGLRPQRRTSGRPDRTPSVRARPPNPARKKLLHALHGGHGGLEHRCYPSVEERPSLGVFADVGLKIRMRARSSILAGALPAEMSLCNRSRSS
jgi:hypothetical protein